MSVESQVITHEATIFNASQLLVKVRELLNQLEVIKLEDTRSLLQSNVVLPISNLKADAIKLTNAKALLTLTHKLALFYKLWNTIAAGIGKDFAFFNIIETAQQIRHFDAVIDWDELGGIIDVESKKLIIKSYKDKLLLTTDTKFEESYNVRDEVSLSKCLQVYFLLEILHDKIINIMNNTLKMMLSKWKIYITSIGEAYEKAMQSTDDEENFINIFDQGIFTYTGEMHKNASKVETLCRLLSNKDQVSQESFESALARGGLSNLFDKYWDNQAAIIEKSMNTLKSSIDKKDERIYNSLVIRYPLFASRLEYVWNMLVHMSSYFDVTYHLNLKNKLIGSIQLLRKDYLEGMKPVSYTHLTLPTKRIV